MPNFHTIRGFYIFLMWLLQCGLLSMLVYINPNHYTTVDSHYYLESAGNMLAGHGYTILEHDHYVWNSTFPIGYPLAIACVSLLTKTSILTASKLVNMLASGLWLFFLHQGFGKNKAFFIALILLSGSFLKLWAHTWSEPMFLVILFSLIYQVYQLNTKTDPSVAQSLKIMVLGILLILVRYAGLFIIPLILGFSLFSFLRNKKKQAVLYFVSALVWSLFFSAYAELNFILGGTWSGGQRFEGKIRFTDNFILFSKGLLNELLLVRDTDFQSPDIIFSIGVTLQLSILAVFIKAFIRNKLKIANLPKFVFYLWTTAVFYLSFLFASRLFSPFDPPGYRLLAPFSFLLLTGISVTIQEGSLTKRLKYFILLLVLLSWTDLVPQKNPVIKVLQSIRSVHPFGINKQKE